MKLAIMQPYLFPYVGYFQLMHAADRFVIADDVTFIKQGWVNRNRLLVNGEPAYFTVPVRRYASDALIRDVEIEERTAAKWRRSLLTTVANFYRRAPSFDAVFPLVERVIGGPFVRIADMAHASLREVRAYLGMTTTVVESWSAYGNRHLKGQQRVIDTCRAESASEYVNAPGGRALYSRDAFLAAGVRLQFVCPDLSPYPQFADRFVPALSIVDLLMFNPLDQARDLVTRYRLE